jgi:hypothetical protein
MAKKAGEKKNRCVVIPMTRRFFFLSKSSPDGGYPSWIEE